MSEFFPIPEPQASIEKPGDRIKPIPAESQAAIDSLKKSLPPEKMDNFFGVSPESSHYRLFHGTIEPRLAAIATSGMRAFEEPGAGEARIFGTASPTMALWHAWENRPHDTLRKQGKIKEEATVGKPVLLLFEVDKKWLSAHPDSARPLPLPAWLKEEKGITPETDHRLFGFTQSLTREVARVKKGKEADDFGIKFPVDLLSAEHIFVMREDGSFQPIKEYVQERGLSPSPES